MSIETLVIPKPGQSLGGLVIEGAAALGERTIRGLLADAGTSLFGLVHHAAGREELASLAKALDLRTEDLVARRHGPLAGEIHRRCYFGVPIDGRMIEKRIRRFAPATLVSEPWHRASWQIRPLPFCETSWTLITDACHACGSLQRWSRAWGIELCDVCTQPLCEGSTAPVPAVLRPRLRLAAGLLHQQASRRSESMAALPDSLRMLGPGGCFDVLCAVSGVLDPTVRATCNPQMPADMAEPNRTIDAIAGAWDMLMGWPDAVLRHCDAKLARRSGRHGDGNDGATTMLLSLDARNGVSPPLGSAIGQLRAAALERQAGHVEARAFVRLSGLKATEVVRRRRAGTIPSILGLTDAGKVVPLLPLDAAERSRSILMGSMMAEHAASRIGCTYRGVEELIIVGLLTRSASSIRDVDGRLHVEGASLDDLLATLAEQSAVQEDGFDVPLKRAMWGIGGRLKPWSAVLRALGDGRLPFVMKSGSRPLAERVVLRRNDAIALRGIESDFDDADRRFDPWMSKSDAFAVLNTEARFADGLLDEWRTCQGPERTVPLSEILKLAERLISLREITALTRGTASASARNFAARRTAVSGGPFHHRAATLAVLNLDRQG
ncbi:hypothetical protein KV697_13575 [Sphingomonas sanguinis]|uniref:hypothetical protein n=1 Tax=Sphingomonas sanguinis TaxID=33051 RepID=UPI001C58696B|nr:hypothetical protein [Sphingomonas sanguinis]QXT34810.1 hypothetical protein KV697_13575 [Sphingomonas sanguinis]